MKLDNHMNYKKYRDKVSNSLKGKKHWWRHSAQWKKGNIPWNKNKTKYNFPQLKSHRKGTTVEEEYGEEKGKLLRKKNSLQQIGKKRSKESIIKQIQTINKSRLLKGKNNPAYTTGISYMANKLKKERKACDICKKLFSEMKKQNKNKHEHHIDKDRNNNKRENILILCAQCHMKKHSEIGDRHGNLSKELWERKLNTKYCELCKKTSTNYSIYFIDKNRKNISVNNAKVLCKKCHQKQQWSKDYK